ncbi:MAG TPA: lantibiotic dehydratase C-terminal domain-containing protein [Pedobacter sp.]
MEDAVELFGRRSALNRNVFNALRQSAIAGDPEAGTDLMVRKLMPSYLHMFLNRIFIANQRMHELVVYHHMAKYYASVIARKKHSPVKTYVS